MDDPSIALRLEAFVAGMELGNAYTELNDPRVQEENFRRQVAGEGDETMAVMDEDFVMALEYGMPPAGGLGVGVDQGFSCYLSRGAAVQESEGFDMRGGESETLPGEIRRIAPGGPVAVEPRPSTAG